MSLEPDAGDLVVGLLDVLPRLLRRLRADLPSAAERPAEGSTCKGLAELRGAPGQVALMKILDKQGRATMQDLASQMAVTPATVTMMVKRLLAQGYVERERDEGDWRLVWVRPTERGRRGLGAVKEERQAALLRRLAGLSPEERASLQAALPALRHLVEVEP